MDSIFMAMTAISFPKSEESPEWSTCRITDELNMCLIKVIELDGCTRKYEKLADFLLYRIPAYRPLPYFIISLSDLDVKLKQELTRLDKKSLNYVTREAVGRIFEGLDHRSRDYYLSRVRNLLKVGLVD